MYRTIPNDILRHLFQYFTCCEQTKLINLRLFHCDAVQSCIRYPWTKHCLRAENELFVIYLQSIHARETGCKRLSFSSNHELREFMSCGRRLAPQLLEKYSPLSDGKTLQREFFIWEMNAYCEFD